MRARSLIGVGLLISAVACSTAVGSGSGASPGVIVAPEAGTPLMFCSAPGLSVNIKIDSVAAGSTRFALGTAAIAPGASNVGTHRLEDEAIYFLRGEGWFFVGRDTAAVRPGVMVFVPQGMVHGFFSTGSTPLEFVWVLSPQGQAARFRRNGLAPGTSCPPARN